MMRMIQRVKYLEGRRGDYLEEKLSVAKRQKENKTVLENY